MPQSSVAQNVSDDSLHLDQVVQEVITHNDRIAAARYMEEAARFKVSPAGAWDDPMFMVGVANLPTSFDFKEDPMTMTMVGVSQSIPLGGSRGLESDAAKADAEAATFDRRAMEVDLAKAAHYAFGDFYYRSRTVELMKAQLELMHIISRAAESRMAAGTGEQHEALAAQAEVWRMEAQVLESIHMMDEAHYELNILRGRPTDSTLPAVATPPTRAIPPSPEPWVEAARRNYPPLAALQRKSAAYDYESQAAGRMSWPMLELSASYAFRFDNGMEMRDDMVNFQAEFSLPIFKGNAQSEKARSMSAMRQSVEAEAQQMSREVEARLRVLHTTAGHLDDQVHLYADRIVPTSEEAFQSALAGYTANRVPYTTLLMLASDIQRDQLMLIETRRQFSRTLADVESLTRDPLTLAPEPASAEAQAHP